MSDHDERFRKTGEDDAVYIRVSRRIPPKEFAYLIGLSHRTVLEYMRTGRLVPHRVPGRRPFFTPEDVERVLHEGFAGKVRHDKDTSHKDNCPAGKTHTGGIE